MTMVINQLLDQHSLYEEIHAQAPFGVADEPPPELSMPFWD
jgi:hypothetical protein